MKQLLGLVALCLGALFITSAQAQAPNFGVGDSNVALWCLNAAGTSWVQMGGPSANCLGGGGGTIVTTPTNSAGAYSAVTVGASSAQALAASTAKVYLDLVNDSTTATIACAFGATAVINGSGSITLPPGWHRSWEGSYVPSDAVNCIASAASTPLTLGAK